MADENTPAAMNDEQSASTTETPKPEKGLTRAASRAVHGVADAGKGVIHKAQDVAKNAIPDAVPDVADKIVDAAAGFATARIDANTKIADRVLTVSRGTGKAVRLAAVIAAVAIAAVLISRRG
ncbi:hypothetical protein PUW81_012385 [Microbacterium sp. NM3R9]|uniref:hypothetical protein n=1 Tax=Microbacterium thalli TaxID=3027921 RepID=UPI0023673921|nr:hypothetical protein [Microbacterium thalli]MDN8549905.1 hypothetical protein [Microbacterium thalli]